MQTPAPPTATVLDAAFAQDPYPVLRELRERGPVHPVLLPPGLPAWLVVSYPEARAALADPRLAMRPPEPAGAPPHPLNLDPPDHTRLRHLLAPAFTRDALAALRPRLEALADALLAELLAGGETEVDLMTTFAQRFPTAALYELLGLPDAGHEAVGALVGVSTAPDATAAERAAADAALLEHAAGLVATAEPAPDGLLARLLAAGDGLTAAELVATVQLLLVVGDETIVHVLGNGLLALLERPAALAALRADPAGLPAAIEEMLRFDGPVHAATPRWATEPVALGPTVVPAGDAVVVSLTGAARDPARYPEPDEFRPGRDNRGGVGFGRGPHFCVGAGLARLELEVAFAALLRRTAAIRLAVPAGALRRRPVPMLRALESLPVVLVPRDAA